MGRESHFKLARGGRRIEQGDSEMTGLPRRDLGVGGPRDLGGHDLALGVEQADAQGGRHNRLVLDIADHTGHGERGVAYEASQAADPATDILTGREPIGSMA